MPVQLILSTARRIPVHNIILRTKLRQNWGKDKETYYKMQVRNMGLLFAPGDSNILDLD